MYYNFISKGKMDSKNIAVFSYDDASTDPHNSWPNHLFTSPDGDDVYKVCNIDYRKENATKKNLINLMSGQSQLKPNFNFTSDDNIFIYLYGHGQGEKFYFNEDILE